MFSIVNQVRYILVGQAFDFKSHYRVGSRHFQTLLGNLGAGVLLVVRDDKYRHQNLFGCAAAVTAGAVINLTGQRFVTESTDGILIVQNLVFLITDSLARVPGCVTSTVVAFDTGEVEAGTELRHIGDAVV